VLGADALTMPKDLIEIAHANGCEAISAFYDRPGMVEPPYVYGLLAGDKEQSSAFWCKRTAIGRKRYLLVVNASDPKLLQGCPRTIRVDGLSRRIVCRDSVAD